MEKYKVNPHPAYRLGFGRVSCMTCIFGNPDQWATVRDLSSERFNEIANYEDEFDSTIQRKESVIDQANRGMSYIQDGDEELAFQSIGEEFPVEDIFTDNWELPRGAFSKCGGPG